MAGTAYDKLFCYSPGLFYYLVKLTNKKTIDRKQIVSYIPSNLFRVLR